MYRTMIPGRTGMRASRRNTFLMMWAVTGILFTTGCFIDFNDGDTGIDNDVVARESFSTEVAVASRHRLRLEGINGNVEITGQPGTTTIIVAGEKQVGSNSLRDAERRLNDLAVRIETDPEEVFIHTDQPRNTQGRNYVIHYTLVVPADFAVRIDLVNGNILVEAVDNAVTLDNVNGNVRLRDIAGSVSVTLTNGNIVSEVALPADGTIHQTTTNGNIALSVPATTSAMFSARVTNGTIHTAGLNLQDATRTNRSVTATLGDGAGTIDLHTVNGNIDVDGF